MHYETLIDLNIKSKIAPDIGGNFSSLLIKKVGENYAFS